MGLGFSIPDNFSLESISELKKVRKKYDLNLNSNSDYIVDVYGSLPYSYIGQTRFPEEVPNISLEQLKSYIQKLHEINIPFHYVMNNPWSCGKELTKKGRDLIFNEIEKLIEIGIDGIILANPLLINKIHEKHPNLDIIASTNLYLSSQTEISNYKDLGASYIVLNRNINRNFPLLKELLEKSSETIILLANTSCLLFCPLYLHHPLITGHASSLPIQENKKSQILLNKSFCYDFCLDKITKNPELLLKVPWIRPEDLCYYEKIGLKYIKIQGRTMNLSDQMLVLKSYLERKTPNNDIFSIWPNFRKTLLKYIENNPSLERTDFNFIIKNSDLEEYGFFDFFIQSNRDCRKGCDNCDYCEKIFEKVYKKYISG